MKKQTISYIVLSVGLGLLIAGFALLKLVAAPQGVLLVLPYICIGVGCGAFGHGVGELLHEKAIKSNPKLHKQMEIEKKDERNIFIANQAKAKAYDSMVYVFGALMLSFALMGVDLVVMLLFVCAYLFIVGSYVYSMNKYGKEM